MALTRKRTLFSALLASVILMLPPDHLAKESGIENAPNREQILKAIEQLSSDDFKLRERQWSQYGKWDVQQNLS